MILELYIPIRMPQAELITPGANTTSVDPLTGGVPAAKHRLLSIRTISRIESQSLHRAPMTWSDDFVQQVAAIKTKRKQELKIN